MKQHQLEALRRKRSRALRDFALSTLLLMEQESDWSADTMATIAETAANLKLAKRSTARFTRTTAAKRTEADDVEDE